MEWKKQMESKPVRELRVRKKTLEAKISFLKELWRSFKTQTVQRLGHTEMGTYEYVFYISFQVPSMRLCLISINLKLYCTYSYKTPSEHTSQSYFQDSS